MLSSNKSTEAKTVATLPVKTSEKALQRLLANPIVLREEKILSSFGNKPLKEDIFLAITEILSNKTIIEQIKPTIIVNDLNKLLSSSQLGDIGDGIYLYSLKHASANQNYYREAANYFYFQALRADDNISCGMLGWHFLEKRQRNIALQFFDISLKLEPSLDNISHVGACLISMERKKSTSYFARDVEFLKTYFSSSTTITKEWHKHISRWILLLGDAFTKGITCEGTPNLAKAKICYELARLFNINSFLAIKRLIDVKLFPKLEDEKKEAIHTTLQEPKPLSALRRCSSFSNILAAAFKTPTVSKPDFHPGIVALSHKRKRSD